MEMKRQLIYTLKARRMLICMTILVLWCTVMRAQQPDRLYTVRDGKMYIELSKKIRATSLDSFISKYSLANLALKQFIVTGFRDSLQKHGWNILRNDALVIAISKPLAAIDNINAPGERTRLSEDLHFTENGFPQLNNMPFAGYNRFRKNSFRVLPDSTVIFYLAGRPEAKKVLLSGNFTNWDISAVTMIRTDSGWIAPVKLRPGKYWYKFIIDNTWIPDPDNRESENDPMGNTNSVYYFTNTIFKLDGYAKARRVIVAGSFNNWNEKEMRLLKTDSGWTLPVFVPNGTHTYKFIVDGQWMEDPSNPDKFRNEFNEFNSVIRVGKPRIFFLPGFADAKEVTLAGSFNNWRTYELNMKKMDSGWELPYTLGPGNYEYRFRVDGNWLTDTAQGPVTYRPGEGANPFFVINPNYTFRLKGYSTAKKILVAGDFNGWNTHSYAMKREGDEWVIDLYLSPGKHLYKFIVDGEWIIDPANDLWEQNEFNTGNSVLWIGL